MVCLSFCFPHTITIQNSMIQFYFSFFLLFQAGYSTLIPGSATAAVTYQKLLKQVRDTQLKVGEMEAAAAKQTLAYQSEYDKDNALGALVKEHLVRCRGSTNNKGSKDLLEKRLKAGYE